MGEIYKAENNINQKVYIGKTIRNLSYRKRNHIYSARTGSSKYFHRSLMKYGIHNFTWATLIISEDEKFLFQKEIEFISLYKSNNPKFGYNLTTGGEGVSGAPAWNKGLTKYTDKRILQISRYLENQVKTEESIQKQKQSLAKYYETHKGSNKGKKVSENTLEKMKAVKGEKHWNYGGHITEEQKKAVSRAQKGKPKSEEHKAHMYKIPKGHIPWNKGIPSEYTKQVQCIETKEIFKSMQEASERYPSAGTHISQVCSGKRKTAGGYHWAYYSD